jgi:hypothetical protein
MSSLAADCPLIGFLTKASVRVFTMPSVSRQTIPDQRCQSTERFYQVSLGFRALPHGERVVSNGFRVSLQFDRLARSDGAQ